ncbi:MAG TPA: DNA internalization-related competence protein ComEC/Rec2 [Bryobacteraceae bacterium]|nr:DNA internalization-related competence protein ComEC/Rec2 [Bryobacteraceae bacterium]
MKAPLVPPLIALATGIALTRWARFETLELAYVIAAFSLLLLLSLRCATRRTTLLCAHLVILFLGAFAATRHRPGPPPKLNAESGEVIEFDGCLIEPPAFSEGREQFLMELAPGARVRVTLTPRDGETMPLLRYGQHLQVIAKVHLPHNFENPGAFDNERYLARQHIYWSASARGVSQLKILSGRCGSRAWAAVFALRVAALGQLETLYADDEYSMGMMEAMLLGESSKLQKGWTDHFRRTGTYHALVISGLHVSVLAGVLLFLLRVCWLPQNWALFTAGSAAWLYALVTGWQTPVVRSAAGFTLFVIARYFFRKGHILNLLAAVALVYLLLDPDQLADAGFQLSFLSVAAIAVFAIPLLEKTSEPYNRALRAMGDVAGDLHMEPKAAQCRVELRLLAETASAWCRIPLAWPLGLLGFGLRAIFYIYGLVLVSAVIQVALVLPMILYFHRVSLSGIPANVLVVPLLSAAVPVGFAAILTGWQLPAILAKWLLLLSRLVVDWHVAREPAWRIPDPPVWLSVAFTAALLAAALADTKWRRCAALVVTLLLFAVLCVHPFPPAVDSGKLELTAIDVGQGDSLLVTFPDGRIILVDSGGFPSFGARAKPKLDIGEDVVSPYLWTRSIRRIDVLVSTHAHEDHMGGAAAVIENFRPRELWTGANPESPGWHAIQDKARQFGVKLVPMQAGMAFAYGGAALEVLAPTAGYETAASPKNNDSLVLRVRFGKHTFLLTGDMERQVEDQLLADHVLSRVDVLKVAHHGSKTSSGVDFLDALRPAFAIVSVGDGNLYRHPHPDVVGRLNERHAAILRTDHLGLATVRSDGKRLEISTQHWNAGAGYAPIVSGPERAF